MKYLVLFALVCVVIWYFFGSKNKKKTSQELVMLECQGCGTFISSNEAFYKGGRVYCSKKCKRENQ
ncbi:PP0621 family protein [Helicobacter anatolicus]|uniref:PP0621 family protein n=1 Tax=Helicobacter anatolicus TaxID=2905874 RepID=UPI001E41B80A|nr:PP0621 family protein [Helicobacter anatolicus]MCE3038954.1 hypothetical protein [Helicobacter anatolicus]